VPQLSAQEQVTVTRVDDGTVATLVARQHIGPGQLEFDVSGRPIGEVRPPRHVLVFDVTENEDRQALQAVIRGTGDEVDIRGSVPLPGLKVEDIEEPAVIRVGSRLVKRMAVGFSV
jgi:hypothetical protein